MLSEIRTGLAAFAEDLLSLVYPHICMACSKAMVKNETCICTSCRYHLPRSGYHNDAANPVIRLFWGRVDVKAAASFLLFSKGSAVQQLVHRLKYDGQKDVGTELGRMYGTDLKGSVLFSNLDVIIPVPLHPSKLRKRGYNQCDLFAGGLSESIGIPAEMRNVHRATASETQTRKSRFERWKNVETIFKVHDPSALEGKHILLVDDVVTTGATLESCAQQLLAIPGTRVSIAAIAFAAPVA